MSAVSSYWQTRVPTSGATASAGKWRARISRARRSCSGTRHAVAVGVEAGRALAVRADLHAAPVDVADAVGGGVVVDPRRDAGRAPRRARAEVEDVLLGDAQVDEAAEQRAAATRRTPRRRGRPRAGGRRRARPRRRPAAPRRARASAPAGDRLRGERLRRVARAQDAGLGLPQPPRDVARRRSSGSSAAGSIREHGIPSAAQRALARGLPAVVAVGEPEHARRARRAPGRSRATAPTRAAPRPRATRPRRARSG